MSAKHTRTVLVDTNVALDLLLAREPSAGEAMHIFALAEAKEIKLLLSTDAISTIFYVVSKNKNARTAREAISKLLDYVTLAGMDEACVLQALTYDFTDIEEALVASVAVDARAEAVVTRNVRDFKNCPLPVLTPAELLGILAHASDFGATGEQA